MPHKVTVARLVSGEVCLEVRDTRGTHLRADGRREESGSARLHQDGPILQILCEGATIHHRSAPAGQQREWELTIARIKGAVLLNVRGEILGDIISMHRATGGPQERGETPERDC